MEENHETHHHKKDGNNTLLYAVIALGVLLIASSAFTMMKISEVSDKTAKLADSETRLNNLETAFNTLAKKVDDKLGDLVVPLVLYYDSQCTTCNNDALLQFADKLKQELQQQGIQLKTTDVFGNPTEPQRLAIPRLPAFYATTAMLTKSEELNKLLSTLEEQGKFTPLNAIDGVALIPPGVTEIISGQSCKNEGVAKLDEFYSETCPYCVRIYDENNTLVNAPNVTAQNGFAIYEQVTDEALTEVEKEFGSKLNATRQCISLRGQAENYANYGVNKSDAELCSQKYSEEQNQRSQALWEQYSLGNIPTFVVDCKYTFTLVIGKPLGEQIKENICAIRPEVCATLPKATLTPEASPTPTTDANATASPAATASPSASPIPA